MNKICFSIALVWGLSSTSFSQNPLVEKVEWKETFSLKNFENETLSLIPFPESVSISKGKLIFNTLYLEENQSDASIKESITQIIPLSKTIANSCKIRISFDQKLGDEAYKLDINKNGISIIAKFNKGVFYAIQTLKQLLQKDGDKFSLPFVQINDQPAFGLRGFMIDVGRNYLSIERLYQIIDELAFYKFNTFHWHLTDNHSWRIESKVFPVLNDPKHQTPTRNPGVYYSYEEIRSLIQYAKTKHINVIPEIDMPGHSEVFTEAMGYKMETEAGRKALKTILKEFFEEIPTSDCPIIHIGSDEVKAKDGEAFIAEMENFINTYNRKIIVWSPGIKASKNTWSQYWGFKKDPYPPFTRNAIDSQKSYINNVEPFTCISQYLFKPIGKNIKQHIKGGIICLWHDVNVNNEKVIFELNPYYLSLAAYIQNLWTAPIKDCSKHLEYHIPISNNELIRYFKSFEDKLMVHQKSFHPKKPFQYSKQINNHWKVYSPIAKNLAANYDSVKKHHPFQHVVGNTVYLKHRKFKWGYTHHIKKNQVVIASASIESKKDQTVPFWIQFETPMRANRRYGGIPSPGEWNTFGSKILINNQEIKGPNWEHAHFKTEKMGGWGNKTEQEIPWYNEEFYWTRKPVELKLKKGINEITLYMPLGFKAENYMFTFAPLNNENIEYIKP